MANEYLSPKVYANAMLKLLKNNLVMGKLVSTTHKNEFKKIGDRMYVKRPPQFLIREGLLLRPLGGALSQVRAGMDGVANSRACGWNRPPIDRMANLNIETGDQSIEQLIGGIEHGVRVDHVYPDAILGQLQRGHPGQLNQSRLGD